MNERQNCHINVTDDRALKAAIARSLLKSQVVRSSEAPPVTVATNDKGWVVFYSPLEPRDNRGRWSAEGPGGPGQAGVRPNKGTWQDQAVELAATGKVLMWSLQDVVEECQRLGFDELEQHAKEQMQNPDHAQWFSELVELAPLVRKLRVHREAGQPVQQPSERWQQSLFGYNPSEARKGKGDPEGGEWTAGGATGAVATDSQPTGTIGQTGNELEPLPDGHKVLELAGHDYQELHNDWYGVIDQYMDWAAKLSGDDQAVVGYYQESGFDTLNPYLRAGAGSGKAQLEVSMTDTPFTTDLAVDELQQVVLSSAAPRDMKLYRGGHTPKALKVGDIVQDDGFVSTSANPEVSTEFTEGMEALGTEYVHGNRQQVFEVDVPKGSPAASLDAVGAHEFDQDEVLLPHGSIFAYMGETPDKMPRFIYLGPAQRHPEMAHFKKQAHGDHGDPSRFIWQEGDLRIVGTVTGETVRFSYNPEEPRDWHGRWTGASGRMTPRTGPAHTVARSTAPAQVSPSVAVAPAEEDWEALSNIADGFFKLGVQSVGMGIQHSPRVAAYMLPVLTQMHDAGMPMPFGVNALHDNTEGKNTVAYFDMGTGDLIVNLNSDFWHTDVMGTTKDAYIASLHEQGWWSTDSATHPVVHEMAHAATRQYWEQSGYAPSYTRMSVWSQGYEQQIAQSVSRYAATSPVEFLAETFTGLYNGVGYSQDVMDLYRKYYGPPLTWKEGLATYAYNPTEARKGKGDPEGGEWTAGGPTAAVTVATRQLPHAAEGDMPPFYGTSSEAIKALANMGLSPNNIILHGNLQAVRVLVPVFTRMNELGLPLPARVIASNGTALGGTTIAAYDDMSDTLYFNENHPYWKSEDSQRRYLKKQMAADWFVTDDPRAIIIHELGHEVAAKGGSQIYRYGPNQWKGGKAAEVAQQVSRYASTRPHEFVAEAFTGLFLGATYSAPVMTLYKAQGGVIPPALEKLETQGAFDWGEAPTSAPTRHRPSAEPKVSEPVDLLQTPLPATTPDGRPVPALPDDITNPRKVEDWLENSLGLTRAVLGSSQQTGMAGIAPRVAAYVAPIMQRLYAQGFQMPRSIYLTTNPEMDEHVMAWFDPSDDSLNLNAIADLWGMSKDTAKMFSLSQGPNGIRAWSTEAHEHTVIHEFAHFLYNQNVHKLHPGGVGIEKADAALHHYLDNVGSKQFEKTLMEVSRYATDSRHEFVAETFAGLYTGHKYSKNVMQLYGLLEGPPVPKPDRKPAATFYMDIVRIPMEVAA